MNEETRELPTIAAYPDFEGKEKLVEKYGNDTSKALQALYESQRQLQGTFRVPPKDATPEQWAEFYRKMGAPESKEGYRIPEDLKDQGTKQLLDRLREDALSEGIPEKTWEKIASKAAEFGNERIGQVESARENWKQQLKELYGAEAETKQQRAQEILAKLTEGDDDFRSALQNTGISDHPGLTNLLVKVSEIVSEDQITGGLGGQADGPDPVALRNRGIELLTSKKLEDRKNPNREQEYGEYLQILKTLEVLGYNGLYDERLTPKDPFAGLR